MSVETKDLEKIARNIFSVELSSYYSSVPLDIWQLVAQNLDIYDLGEHIKKYHTGSDKIKDNIHYEFLSNITGQSILEEIKEQEEEEFFTQMNEDPDYIRWLENNYSPDYNVYENEYYDNENI